MRLLRRWGYLLLLTVVTIVATIHNHNVLSVVMFISLLLGILIYTKYKKSHKRIWLAPASVVFALMMGIIYYAADAVLFPHSQQAAQRLGEACMLGPMLAVFGLLLAAASFAGTARTMP